MRFNPASSYTYHVIRCKNKYTVMIITMTCTHPEGTRGSEEYIHSFLASALERGKWLPSRPDHCKPGRSASPMQWVGDDVEAREDLDDLEEQKSACLTLVPESNYNYSFIQSVVQSLYRLSHPGPQIVIKCKIKWLYNNNNNCSNKNFHTTVPV